MELGILDWYSDEKGFGLLVTPKGEQVFLHYSNWKESKRLKMQKDKVFVFEKNFQRNRTTALEVRFFSLKNPFHKRILLAYFDKSIKDENTLEILNYLDLLLNNSDKENESGNVKELLLDLLEIPKDKDLLDSNAVNSC